MSDTSCLTKLQHCADQFSFKHRPTVFLEQSIRETVRLWTHRPRNAVQTMCIDTCFIQGLSGGRHHKRYSDFAPFVTFVILWTLISHPMTGHVRYPCHFCITWTNVAATGHKHSLGTTLHRDDLIGFPKPRISVKSHPSRIVFDTSSVSSS